MKRPAAIMLIGGLVVLGGAGVYFGARRALNTKVYRIPSPSMENTLHVGDLVVVDAGAYDGRMPERGDIVVFEAPERALHPDQVAAGVHFIMRCIGTPGDTVEIRAGALYLNDKQTPEKYVQEGSWVDFKLVKQGDRYVPVTIAGDGSINRDAIDDFQIPDDPNQEEALRKLPPTPVPEGYIFVMGDNRNKASDSRFWGLLPRASLIGKAKVDR